MDSKERPFTPQTSTGPTYTRIRCCANGSCKGFESWTEVGECYSAGGRVTRDCSTCK